VNAVKRLPKTLQATAYHEAGHAVLAREFGISIDHVTIVPNEAANSLGHVLRASTSDWEHDLRTEGDVEPAQWGPMFQHVVQSLAGCVAEAKFTGRHNYQGAHSDRVSVYDALTAIAAEEQERRALFKWLWVRTENHLARPRVWAQVEAVAHALLEQQTLTAEQFNDVCMDALQIPRSQRIQPKNWADEEARWNEICESIAATIISILDDNSYPADWQMELCRDLLRSTGPVLAALQHMVEERNPPQKPEDASETVE
jgi:hypothetical protein